MRSFSATPWEMFVSLWRNRDLVVALIKREVLGRYRGSYFGIFWSFFHPLFMLAVYTFVFSVVFQARWSGGSDSKTEFALMLFAGLMVYNLFSECINRAPAQVISNSNYVKKVVFPLEVLPWAAMGAALFNSCISFIVWLAFYAMFFGIPHVTVLLFPLVIFPLILFTMGLSWALAAIGVYLRDVSQFIGIITTTLLFMSPIFYPVSALPEQYQSLLQLNPLTPIIEQVRSILVLGRVPDVMQYGVCLVVGAIVSWLGFAVFQKTRKGFADVL